MTDLNSKTEKVEIRLTKSEKERLKQFAAQKHISMSELIRWLCEDIFKIKEED